MSEAFPAIAEPAADSEPPLQAMASCNQRMLRHCATLRRLALYLGECGFDGEAQAATAALFRFFDQVLPRHQRIEERELFPAVLEAMAGSDAVCIREMNDSISQQHGRLQRSWRQLRPALQEVANGRATALPVHEVEEFVACCQQCASRETGELLPMAERLLSDEQVAQLGAALREAAGDSSG